jgi:DNA-directed RNA polymerase specialized sigma subunit, sigma24 homolog
MASARRLERDDAFYAFMWKIASNTFRKYIRKKQDNYIPFDEQFVGVYWKTPEDEYVESEQLGLLRRELSMLAGQYRAVTVAYYIKGKSCSEIAVSQGISEDMVKYYLFKTRKMLKEGIGMAREFGERSYNPGTFRMDYWGGGNNSIYWNLFKRLLPGNILLAAYETPMSVNELSSEMGVATVYLEDELEPLEQHGIIRKLGEKYQTNIVIFADSAEKEIAALIKPISENAGKEVYTALTKLLPKLRALDFKGNDYNDNRMLWTFTNIVMMMALSIRDGETRQRFGGYPPLSNGSYGFIYGYDHKCDNHHFNGIYGNCENDDKTAFISAENYRIIEKSQKWKPVNWNKSVRAMTDAVLCKPVDENNDVLIQIIGEGFISINNGVLNAEFPVFTAECLYNQVWELIKPICETVAIHIGEICDKAADIFVKTAPKQLGDRRAQLTYIKYQTDSMAFIVESMVEQKYLIIPDTDEKLCIYGVIRM